MKNFFKEHDLFKISILVILFTFVLTWIIPATDLSYGLGTTVYARLGISDMMLSGVYTMNFFLQQIFFLVVVGVFYGIISKTEGYKKLVFNIAQKLKGKEIYFILITSLVIAGFTSIVTNVYILLVFIPFIISIILNMKLDKLTAFLATFGSILIGVLGATYGTEGLTSFISYLGYYNTASIESGVLVRFGILVLGYILFSYFTIAHVKSTLKVTDTKETKTKGKKEKEETEIEEKVEDRFLVEKATDKNAKTWPIILSFFIMLVFVVLGYVNWNTFGITVFDRFHEWLLALKIGNFYIISEILGGQSAAFGLWNLHHIAIVMGVVLIFIVLMYKGSLKDSITNAGDGIKKISKVIGIMILVYVLFTFMYWSPIASTIVDWITKGSESFNPFLNAIAGIVTGFFYNDFGYTSYAIGTLFTNYSAAEITNSVTIFSSMNGIMSIISPTSAILMVGLAYLDIPFKKWVKYIWKFVVGMLVCLFVIFALLSYL